MVSWYFLHLRTNVRKNDLSKAPPVAPNPPVITLLNATVMSVSWSAPWIHPIQSYTLHISSNSFENTVTTSSTNYVLNKRNITECEVVNFTVRANTEIGSSEFSSKTVKGFPTGIYVMVNV